MKDWLPDDHLVYFVMDVVGEAAWSFQTPPSQSQIRDALARHSLTESGFGGWADEKIEIAREAVPLLSRKKVSSTTFDNISAVNVNNHYEGRAVMTIDT